MSLAQCSPEGKSESVLSAGNELLDVARSLDQYVRQAAADGQPLRDVEHRVFDAALEMGRKAVDLFLEQQGDGDLGETVTTDEGGTLKRSAEPVDRPLRTVFGPHLFRQYVYSRGEKRKIDLRPLDARMSLPEGIASYMFEEFSQLFCVEEAFGQSHRSVQEVLRQQVCVDTLERINRRLGAQATEYLDQLPTPRADQEAEVLVFTGDAKGVPLVKPDAVRVPAGEDSPERPGNRRMATLASVYSVDRYVRTPEEVVAALFRDEERPDPKRRPRPKFKHTIARFGRIYEDGAGTVEVPGVFEAFSWASGQIAARRRPGQPLVRLMDGQESLWDAADVCLESESDADILDVIHVAGYLWRAGKVFECDDGRRQVFVRERLLRILHGQAASVISGLRQMATKHNLRGDRRKTIMTVCGYFQKNLHRMRYDEYLAAGYPIASGVIEGACRHLVKDRMERTGMRWRLEPAQAMLSVRAVFQSSYWEDFHDTRFRLEQSRLHPHRQLLRTYTPLKA